MRVIYRPKKTIVPVGGYGLLYNWWATQEQIAEVEYGYLYNWYAATGGSFVSGWHLPTADEWSELGLFLDPSGDSMTNVAGGKLKETGTAYWEAPNTGADNSSGFNLRASGRRDLDGIFTDMGTYATLWKSDNTPPEYYYQIVWVQYNESTFYYPISGDAVTVGMAIRLICDSSTDPGFVDIDGHRYSTVKIGNQVWMAENLAAKKYADGTPIPEVTDNTAWAALTTGARCSYNNAESNAFTTTKITSSDDWVVPTSDQVLTMYNELYSYVGEEYPIDLNKSLRGVGYTYWQNDEISIEGTNVSGFNARGGGWRTGGEFFNLKKLAYWYMSSMSTEPTPRPTTYGVEYDGYTIVVPDNPENADAGLSLRLIYNGIGTPTEYIGNNGTVYSIVTIGSQIWLAENLKETKFRDGSWIHGYDGGVYTPIADVDWATLGSAALCVYDDNLSNI